MHEIQCRTVEGHIDPKATGLDVECSLERGLVCKSDRSQGIRCPDFEIRVLCGCEKPNLDLEVEPPPRESCDVNSPNKKHETDCHAFYQCVPSVVGNVFVEKTCGPNMWYNPQTMICDWQESVLKVRPECAGNLIKLILVLDRSSIKNLIHIIFMLCRFRNANF